jgi:hypothetical protein
VEDEAMTQDLRPAAIGFAMAAAFLAQAQAQAGPSHEALWRAAIARKPAPAHGCFEAAYPLLVWKQVGCVAAPSRPIANTVGAGHDYVAVTRQRTSSATGSFPAVKGLKWEKGSDGRPNDYTLQLNSNFMAHEPACAGAADPQQCRGWQQFAYSSGFGVAFMQYWLIDYGAACPAGWEAFQNHCFKNSDALGVPLLPVKQIKDTSLSGTAVKGGVDTLVLTTKRNAYTVTGGDDIVHLAKGWKESEFNVFGDGGSLQANFNPGTVLTVQIDVTDGTRRAPHCTLDGGTTGETNNLTLGACIAAGGDAPAIQFKESN